MTSLPVYKTSHIVVDENWNDRMTHHYWHKRQSTADARDIAGAISDRQLWAYYRLIIGRAAWDMEDIAARDTAKPPQAAVDSYQQCDANRTPTIVIYPGTRVANRAPGNNAG